MINLRETAMNDPSNIKVASALALWLLLTSITGISVSADPASEGALKVAFAQPDQTRTESLQVSHLRDAGRINSAIRSDLRADLRADLDANMKSNLETLLAAAEPSADED